MNDKSVLITGGAQRIGAAIAKSLHEKGYTVFLHYGNSEQAANDLMQRLNNIRKDSCFIFSADLSQPKATDNIKNWLLSYTNTLNILINNASVFYPTPWQQTSIEQWQQIFTVNSQTPFFLTQTLLPNLKPCKGQVINLIDIHVERGLEEHPLYNASKAALKSLTLSLAKDLKGQVRCNGISPGAILWPESETNIEQQKEILKKIPLGQLGDVNNIVQTVQFLIENTYMNGQIINVDGGRTLHS